MTNLEIGTHLGRIREIIGNPPSATPEELAVILKEKGFDLTMEQVKLVIPIDKNASPIDFIGAYSIYWQTVQEAHDVAFFGSDKDKSRIAHIIYYVLYDFLPKDK